MRSLPLLLLTAALLAACSDDERRPPGNNGGGGDASTSNDSGGNNNGADSGSTENDGGTNPGPDGGGNQDAMTNPGACNTENGSGCTGTDLCVYVASVNMAQCRVPAAAPKAHEEACSTQLHDCGAGLTCVQLPGEMGPTCKKVCLEGNNTHCAGLTGMATNGYFCPGSFPNAPNGEGVCIAQPEDCVPHSDSCPANQYCELIGANNTGCVPEGNVPVNGSCGPGQCMRGGVCINIGSGGTCYEPCNTATGLCSTGAMRCLGLQDLSFGICPAVCDVFQVNCPQTDSCQPYNDISIAGCLPSESGSAGQPCSNTCARGNICVNQVCRVPCDANNPCATGMCDTSGGGPFGICL